MRQGLFAFRYIANLILIVGIAFLMSDCFAQTVHQPTPRQEDNLRAFLQGYLRDPLYDYKTTRYLSAFVDLRDDGTQEVIVYFTDQHSCGSGGCTTMVLTPQDSSYKVITTVTIARLPIRLLATKSNGWHDITVLVEGGGIQPGYEARLSFNGRTYPANPTVPPARRLTGNAVGKVVIPVNGESKPLFE